MVSKIHTGRTPALFENSCIENIDRLETSFGTSIEISIETYNVPAVGRAWGRRRICACLARTTPSSFYLFLCLSLRATRGRTCSFSDSVQRRYCEVERREAGLSVFHFIFFCFAAGFLVNRRHGKSPSFVHNHSCCFCFPFPLWNRAWRMSCRCRPVRTGGALFPGSSFYFFCFFVCCDCDIKHLRLLEHENGCRVLMPALCGHFIELFAALTRLSTRLFCVLFLQSYSPRQRYLLFLSLSSLPGRSHVFVWLLRCCVLSSKPALASFS